MTLIDDTTDQLERARARRRFYSILESDDAATLSREAIKRNMLPNKLATELLRVIIRDNLINAVLDDGAAAPVKRRPIVRRVS